MSEIHLYRDVRTMSLHSLQRERDLIRPFIRDLVSRKLERIDEINREIARRGSEGRKVQLSENP